MTKIKRGFRIRLYPNDAQKQQIAVSFGCSRWLWNNMLAMQKERHDNEPSAPYLSAFSMNYLLKQLKREYPWLKDADSTALTGTPENLHDAYTRFFKGQTRFPKFKSKKHEQSYISKCVNNNIVIITSAFQSRVPYTSKLENSLMDESVPLLSDRKHQENTKHLFFANMRKSIFQRQERQSVLMLVSRILQFFLMEQKSDCLVLTNDQRSNFIIGKESHQEDFFQLKR